MSGIVGRFESSARMSWFQGVDLAKAYSDKSADDLDFFPPSFIQHRSSERAHGRRPRHTHVSNLAKELPSGKISMLLRIDGMGFHLDGKLACQ